MPFFLSACILQVSAQKDSTPSSTRAEALAYLGKIKDLAPSKHWPNIKPAAYLQNLQQNINQPLSLYEGRNTNFCAYAAISYLPLKFDPLSYARFMIAIYQKGEAKFGRALIRPSEAVRQAAGRLSFKGELDIRPADQLWFFCLADHFKGYVNLFDHHFNMGDENKIWAAVNFAKFNRMVRQLFNYETEAVGSDLLRPGVRNLYTYLKKRLATGTVALFLNNMYLYKKNHSMVKLGYPTHFVILMDIEETTDGKINIIYWDYGGRSLQQVSPAFLKRIIFGITHCTKKTRDAV